MRSSQSPPFPYGFGEFGDDPPQESRRLTPSIGLLHDSDQPNDSSNEDFLFHLYRGSELLQDNRVHEAKEELERALHLQPRDSKGQDLIAVVYFRLGLYPRAIQIYEALRRRNATDTSLLLNLALCYLKTGQPQLARRDLEQLLGLNPTHSRAWGYLGLACERLGDLAQAQRAFEQGGHAQMARRIAARREEQAALQPPPAPPPQAASAPGQEIRDVAGAAYQELDAGELSFALAEPTSDKERGDGSAESWRSHEPGSAHRSSREVDGGRPDTKKPDTKDGPPAAPAPAVPQLGRAPTSQQGFNRRPTLIAPVGAPPAYGFLATELATLDRIPSQKPPSFALDDAGSLPPVPSLRRPVVAVPSPFGPAKAHEYESLDDPGRTRTLAPPLGHGSAPPQGPGSTPPEEPTFREEGLPVAGSLDDWEPHPQPPPHPPLDPHVTSPPPPAVALEDAVETRAVGMSGAGPSAPPQTPLGIGPEPERNLPVVMPEPEPQAASASPEPPRSLSLKPETTRSSGSVAPVSMEPRQARAVSFPLTGVVLHPSGLALARTTLEVGFVARLEAFRAQQSGVKMALLERHVKGKPNGESFGGVASPMVLVTGEGELVLGARPGRKLHAYPIDEMCFAREDVLLGFGGGSMPIAFENGRLTTGESEHLPVVQLRGDGAVLIEAIGDVVALAVHSERSLSVRREAILGWFGRLVPRAIAPADAPCGQRGLVSFAGEGRVLLAGA